MIQLNLFKNNKNSPIYKSTTAHCNFTPILCSDNDYLMLAKIQKMFDWITEMLRLPSTWCFACKINSAILSKEAFHIISVNIKGIKETLLIFQL